MYTYPVQDGLNEGTSDCKSPHYSRCEHPAKSFGRRRGGVSYITINHTTYASDGSSRVEQIGFKQKESEEKSVRASAHRANPNQKPNISAMEKMVLKEHREKTHSSVAFSRKNR